MSIDRRTVLRGMAKTTAAGAVGAALAAANIRRPPSALAPHPARPHPAAFAAAPARWTAPRPAVVPRSNWQPGDAIRGRQAPPRTQEIQAVFIHHTDTGNGYRAQDVPELIRSIRHDHVGSRDWDDIGYNFLVDKNGTIYEGRAGGVDTPVVGAHTVGFNFGTVGIAAIGTYGTGAVVPDALLDAIARLAAWKLGLYGVDPRGRTTLVSTNSESRFPRGTRATFSTISGHRDGVSTECPGNALYAMLPAIRAEAARLQGRTGQPVTHTAVPVRAGRAAYRPAWPVHRPG